MSAFATSRGVKRVRVSCAALAWLAAVAGAAEPPVDLGGGQNVNATGFNYASAAVTLADGTLESFARRSSGGHVSIFRSRSTDHGRSWTEPQALVNLDVAPWGGPVPLLDQDQELHFLIPRVRGEGRRPAVDRFIDLYHLRSFDGRMRWSEPRRVYEGYCGALQGVFQTSSGRIIVPFADWRPQVPTAPPTGPSVTIALYSDDHGDSWQRSAAALTAPCFDGYNGANYGACEPTLIELQDKRLWMLIRTQAGYLYESFSGDDGGGWSAAQPSPFVSSNSPAFPIRLADGRLVVFWNNCVMPDRVHGRDGVYAGRDALHAAISADDGRTWRGFREVYRDPTRNESPPQSGDRGTAYPHATLTGDGKMLLVSGQGTDRRRRFLIDPDWLLETEQRDDFQNLQAWHLFKGFGPVKRWWRDRVAGPRLIPHPDREGAHVLQVRRADERDADGASWNFPAGRGGRLELRLRLEEGFRGARISLTDRFFDPCDDQGEAQAVFGLALHPDGRLGASATRLAAGKWYQLVIQWPGTGEGDPARVSVDDCFATFVPGRGARHGVSYLRLRSTAEAIDDHGMLVESVAVTVQP